MTIPIQPYYLVRKLVAGSFDNTQPDWSVEFDLATNSAISTIAGEINYQGWAGLATCFGIGMINLNPFTLAFNTNAGLGTSRIQFVVNGIVNTYDGVSDPEIDFYAGPNQVWVIGQPGNNVQVDWALFTSNNNTQFVSLFPAGSDPFFAASPGSGGIMNQGLRNVS